MATEYAPDKATRCGGFQYPGLLTIPAERKSILASDDNVQMKQLNAQTVLCWLLDLSPVDMDDFLRLLLNERPALWNTFCAPPAASDTLSPDTGGSGEIKLDIDCDKVDNDVPPLGEVRQTTADSKNSQGSSFKSAAPGIDAAKLMAEIDEECMSLLNGAAEVPTHPTVQFSRPMFYGQERDGFVEIELMRIGPVHMIRQSAACVYWTTVDGSAKAGHKYVGSSGKAEFLPGAPSVTFRIELLNDTEWDPTLDFSVELQTKGVQNLELHRYHMHCRVKVVDDDNFPSDKFTADQLVSNDAPVDHTTLMLEYLKMNFNNREIHKASLKILASDALENVFYILTLTTTVLMINQLFLPVIKGEREWYQGSHTALLAFCAFIFWGSEHLCHVLAYRKVWWHVGGNSRKHLQANLMRKYMSYSDKSLEDTDQGLVILVLFKEIPELVGKAYMSLFGLVKGITALVLLVLYQTVGANALRLSTAEAPWYYPVNLSIVFCFPSIMFICLKIRSPDSQRLKEAMKEEELRCTSLTLDTLANFFLLADYGKRSERMQRFEEHIDYFNIAFARHAGHSLNNEFVPKSITYTIHALWVFVGGTLVADGDIELGTFLVSMTVFTRIGLLWAEVYRHVLNIDECGATLQTVVRLMNLPTADADEAHFTSTCSRLEREMAKSLNSSPQDIQADQLPICVNNYSHCFVTGSRAFSHVSIQMEQSKVHMLAGRRGSGKTTLLRLIGCRIVKPHDQVGSLFLPAHLHLLHVSKEPLFFMGSLYDNLTYGVRKDDKDGSLERVLNICKLLEINDKTLKMITDQPDAAIDRWTEVLSKSDCHLMNIARGLIANPAILCLHKPSMGLGPNTVPNVFRCLRRYVRARGLLQLPEKYNFRRPRTCIYTFNSRGDEEYADVVHEPFAAASGAVAGAKFGH